MAFAVTAGQKQHHHRQQQQQKLGPERATGGGSSSSSLGFAGFGDSAAALSPSPSPSQQQQQQEFHVVQRYNSAMAQQQAERSQQSHHFAVNEDTKSSTHDFLSLYDKGSHQVDNGSTAGSLTTHDFLQPLERNGGRSSSYRAVDAPTPRTERPAREPNPAQSRHSTPAPGDRMNSHSGGALPNYPVPVPYAVPPNSMLRMVGEAEVLRQSRGGYPVATLSSSREDHAGPESLRGVEVALEPEATSARENLAYWPGVRFKFGMPSDLTFPAGIPLVKSGAENGHQSMPAMPKQWAQGMIEVPKRSARPPSEEDDDDDEDSSERIKASRKEPMMHKGDAAQRMDSKSADLRACTPRSKHSATEQRRRSKINDRFQMLRDLVPHSDQKRDKASFLLEVIEYIQVLQEKVRKFENVEQGRNQERLKSMVWDLCKRGAAGTGEDISQINALVFAKDFGPGVTPVDVKPATDATIADLGREPRSSSEQAAILAAPATTAGATSNAASRPACSIHSCVSSLEGEKENPTALTAQPLGVVGVTSLQRAMTLPYALPIVPSRAGPSASNSPAKEPDTVSSLENGADHHFEVRPRISLDQSSVGQQSKSEAQRSAATFVGSRIDGPARAGTPPSTSAQARQLQGGAASLHHHENVSKQTRHDHATPGDACAASPSAAAQSFPRIQAGVINVSSVYSQGLLDTLTRALQNSGVDLSKANISVQIDLGQNATVAAVDTSVKVATTPESSAQSHQSQGRTRPSPAPTEPEPALKRPKLESHE